MIVNLSVPAPRERVSELGAVLASFQAQGVEVSFTGPWPPYSFANAAFEQVTGPAAVGGTGHGLA